MAGPYIGQMEAVIASISPQARLINLLSDAPVHNPRAAAYLLAAYQQPFAANTIFLCVVDPAVGTDQHTPVIIKAHDKLFVGPDNGLFDALIVQTTDCRAWALDWRPPQLSRSFHGRDLYAPVAATLATGEWPETTAMEASPRTCLTDLEEIIYIDHFGNAMTGVRAATIAPSATVYVADQAVVRADTFASVAQGEVFWYENANGLLEIAANQARVSDMHGIMVGDAVEIRT